MSPHQHGKEGCSCIRCTLREIGQDRRDYFSSWCSGKQPRSEDQRPRCPYCNANWLTLWDDRDAPRHFRVHFTKPGPKDGQKYLCKHSGCHASSKNWTDFLRHSRSHCTSKSRDLFDCPIAWCDRKNNSGFPRKDKMMQHVRQAHKMDPKAFALGRSGTGSAARIRSLAPAPIRADAALAASGTAIGPIRHNSRASARGQSTEAVDDATDPNSTHDA
jgi:hypothetical protein